MRRVEALEDVRDRLLGVADEPVEQPPTDPTEPGDDGLTDFQRQWLALDDPPDETDAEATTDEADLALTEPGWWEGLPAVRQLLLDGLNLGAGTVFIGENGSGKSTLIEGLAMAYGLAPEGGSTGSQHRTRPSESGLGHQLRYTRNARGGRSGYFLRAETMHSFFTYLEENPSFHPDEPAFHELSHGESFMALVELRMPHRRPGVYFLDEPESALSFDNQIRLVHHLHSLMRTGQHQVIMATHSPILAALPDADLYQVDAERGFYLVDHDDAPLVRKWREFMNAPAKFLPGWE